MSEIGLIIAVIYYLTVGTLTLVKMMYSHIGEITVGDIICSLILSVGFPLILLIY